MMKKYLPVIAFLFVAGGFGRVGGQTLTNLHTFGAASSTDGSQPRAGLVQGTNGFFYGTTYLGGTNHAGTVFAINSQGTLTNVWSFSGPDGQNPSAALTLGNDGNFYGTTVNGGSNGWGTVFRLSPQGTFSNLWQFNNTNGGGPTAGLVLGRDGNFYGTTEKGGTNNDGTIFQITTNGTLTTLWQFGTDTNNGIEPLAGLVQGTDGNFYGVAPFGGTNRFGTVFRITPQGMLTNLWQFTTNNFTNGLVPLATLVQGNDGSFYGTTEGGGTNNLGAIFRITTNGMLTSLWSFSGTDGENPTSLTLGSDGNFYGTTPRAGLNSAGTIFQFNTNGTLTTLWQFGTDTNRGTEPLAGLVQGSDGNWYGTAALGGTNGTGTVFALLTAPNPVASIRLDPSGASVVLSIPVAAHAACQLQFSPSLNPMSWTNVPNGLVTNSPGGLLTFTNSGVKSGPQGFFRFVITP